MIKQKIQLFQQQKGWIHQWWESTQSAKGANFNWWKVCEEKLCCCNEIKKKSLSHKQHWCKQHKTNICKSLLLMWLLHQVWWWETVAVENPSQSQSCQAYVILNPKLAQPWNQIFSEALFEQSIHTKRVLQWLFPAYCAHTFSTQNDLFSHNYFYLSFVQFTNEMHLIRFQFGFSNDFFFPTVPTLFPHKMICFHIFPKVRQNKTILAWNSCCDVMFWVQP